MRDDRGVIMVKGYGYILKAELIKSGDRSNMRYKVKRGVEGFGFS